MSKLKEMHAKVLELSHMTVAQAHRYNPEMMVALSEACENLAAAYQCMREVELEELSIPSIDK